jgi:hypothetical protein
LQVELIASRELIWTPVSVLLAWYI